ncbi:MAG: MBL fold metallo-hydrolase [Halioglobus sp.]
MDRKIFVLGFSALLNLFVGSLQAETLEITFLDVDEGEAIFLESGNQSALIDSGNIATGTRVVQHLRKRGIDELDWVLLTHPHLDHSGGIFQILPQIPTRQRYDNGQLLPENQDIYRWYKDFFRSGQYRAVKEGETLSLGEARVVVLSSVQGGKSNMNKNSLVLLVEHDAVRLLLMADADASIEAKLMEQAYNLSATLLKVGHHGAEDATSQEFLERVNPDYAVISINAGNIRGFPSPRVLERLQEQRITFFTTYADGNVHFSSDGKVLKINH